MEVLWFVAGTVLGGTAVYLLVGRNRHHRAELEKLFAALSHDALSKNSDEFLKLAQTRFEQQAGVGAEQLESKKKLIDANLKEIADKLRELTNITQSIDKDRRESFGAIRTELTKTTEAAGLLGKVTGQLKETLANPQRRGQWGERMADDILRLAGMVEGVNYKRQQTTDSGDRPDISFLLPSGLVLNADVKFPLPNYLRAVEAADEAESKRHQAAFLKDVRAHLKSVTSRDYIDQEGGTVDCVLVFIPNEQIYGYLHEHDPTLVDDALSQKIILCSPMTLYAVLSVVRQAVDNFRLQQTSREILDLLGAFRREWDKYGEVVDKMERAVEQVVKNFDLLKSTRTRKLERQLDRIEDLRIAEGPETTERPEETQRALIPPDQFSD